MSMFSWMFPAPKPAKPQAESSGLSQMEAARPVNRRSGKDSPVSNAQPANRKGERKGERMARRELLYAIVRESMMRAGVLSASYKFKVLSLDGRGRQFLVMVDLSRDSGAETSRLAEIESMIAQAAKLRHDILVTAVYWRSDEHVAIGDPVKAAQRVPESSPSPLESQPAVFDSAPAPVSQPVPIAAAAPAAPRRTSAPRFDPIEADEVAAFKQALIAGAPNPAAVAVSHGASARTFDGSAMHGPQSYTLLTGFEDTELPDPDRRTPALSGTQYGELG